MQWQKKICLFYVIVCVSRWRKSAANTYNNGSIKQHWISYDLYHKNLYIILNLLLHWYNTAQFIRVYHAFLWIKITAVHSFNTQFYQEYIFIDLICSKGKKFVWTTSLLIYTYILNVLLLFIIIKFVRLVWSVSFKMTLTLWM